MESQPISLNFKFQEITDVNSASGSFSQTFRLPVTDKNALFFSHVEDPDYVLFDYAFNPKTKFEAWIADDGIPIMQGSLQLTQVVKRNGRAHEYEVIVVGNTGDLITGIRNLKLSDLDLTDLDHFLSASELGLDLAQPYTQNDGLLNNNLSSSSTIDSSMDGHFCYGFFDWRSMGLEFDQDNPYPFQRLVPFVKIWKLLELIVEQAGYTYTSDFFSDGGEGYKVWMPIYNGEGYVKFNSNTDVQSNAYADPPDTDTIPAVSANGMSFPELDGWDQTPLQGVANRYIVPWPHDPDYTSGAQVGTDTEGMFQSDGVIEIQTAGIYRFEIMSTFRRTNEYLSAFGAVSHGLYKQLGDTIGLTDNFEFTDEQVAFETHYMSAGTQTTYTLTAQNVVCSTGDKFYVKIFQGFGAYDENDTLQNHIFVVNSNTVVTMTGGNDDEDTAVDLNTMMPDMTLVDYLSGLQKTFNLVFVPDEDRKHFKIEPASDFLYTGSLLDWHDKVDYSSDVVIKPTTDLQSRKYNFTHAEGANYVNVSFQETALRVAGRYKIEDTENEWATGETEITNGFAPFTPTRGTDNLYLFQAYDGSGEPLSKGDQPPMLCYGKLAPAQLNDGQADWFFAYDFYSTSNDYDYTTLDEVMYFSPFSDQPATASSKALLYGEDRFAEEDTQPIYTLFREYWEDYFLEQYSTEARIMECRMFLTKADINQLNFADTIRLNEGTWRLLSISNYTANAEEPCSVTLIRAVTEIRPCEFFPTGTSAFDTQVTFTNSAGTSGLVGSKKCCEYYGYNWEGGRCMRSPIAIGSIAGGSTNGVGGGVLRAIFNALGGRDIVRLNRPLSGLARVFGFDDDGLINELPLKGDAEIIRATNIAQTTERKFATETQLNNIASNSLTVSSHTDSIADIENTTDLITVTSATNLDAVRNTTDAITINPAGDITAFTIATGRTVLTADNVDDASTTHKFTTQAGVTKLGHISVSQSVDLDAMETDISTLQSEMDVVENALDEANNGASARSGQSGVEVATFNSSGVLGSVSDGSKGARLQTSGTGSLSFSTIERFYLNGGAQLAYPYARYLPLTGYVIEQNTSGTNMAITSFLAPFDGNIVKILARAEQDIGNTSLTWYKASDGTNAPGTLMQAKTVDMETANTTYTFTYTKASVTFDKGDTLALKVDPTNDPTGNMDFNYMIIFEFDYST